MRCANVTSERGEILWVGMRREEDEVVGGRPVAMWGAQRVILV